MAAATPSRVLMHVARDDARMAQLAEAVAFFHPHLECLSFPAWDCLPYDRVSPNPQIVSQRMETLNRLAAQGSAGPGGRLIITTINAVLQRVPAGRSIADVHLELAPKGTLDLDTFVRFLDCNGYTRSGTVSEPGDYAPRGGIIDIFPPGMETPFRIDMFGDEIDNIRAFDPLSQRSAERVERLILTPVTEYQLDEDTINRFREGYRELFGANTGDDPLYEAISAGRKHQGAEHWLAFFHDNLETLFDYLP